MKKDSVLGGFEAVLDQLTPGQKPKDNDDFTPSFDENGVEHGTIDDDDEDIYDDESQDDDLESADDIDKDDQQEPNDDETDLISGMFDAFVEKYQWDIDAEDKPKTIDEFMDYIQAVVEDNSKPQYSSTEIEQLDEYVRNGGNIRDYLRASSDVDLDNIDLTSEDNQKTIVRTLLKRQGLSDSMISRKINKYEDADILADEAEEALEYLKKSIDSDKERLLEEQKKFAQEQEVAQQKFYTSVVDTVKALKDIRGIAIPEKDKKELLEYIFKPTKTGRTQYQEEYQSSISNLIESAYFTKNKNKLIDSAKKAGETTAVERFKQKLKTGTKTTSKHTMSGGSGKALWEML